MTSTPTGNSKGRESKEGESEEIQKIGKYKVLGALGRGSMGVVYRGQDPEIGRIVAIKVLRNKAFQGADSHVALERFKSEARSAGNLRHPHIITVFDVNIDGENPYIVMDFLEGQTLSQILNQQKKLSPRQAMHYLWQIASGLDHAHSKSVIHRDIKPSNILIDKSDNAFILDFGVASFGEGTINDQSFLGTPNYMSPEQPQRKQIDYRADLFSFAVLAYEVLTGRKPFLADNLATLVNQIVNGVALQLSETAPELPLPLQVEFDKALSKNPEIRFVNADSMIAAFSAALGQSGPAAQGGGDRKRRFSDWKVVNSLQNKMSKNHEPERVRKATPVEVSPWRPEARTVHADSFTLTKGASYSDRPGTMYSENDYVFEAGRIDIGRYRNVTRILAAMCILLSIFLIYMYFTSPGPDKELAEVDDYTITSLNHEALPDKTDPATLPKSEPIQGNKSIFELTDVQLLSILQSTNSSEGDVVQAIREAKQRSMSRFVDAAPVLLKRDSYVVRIETLKLLTELGDSRVVPSVIVTLDDYDPLVRRWAAKTLAKIGDRKVVGYLEARLIKDDVEDVKADIRKAIEKITGVPYAR